MIYNPWKHADQLGLRVIEGDPGQGNRGLWAGNGLIILKPHQTELKARCTLSHEIVHAQYDPPLIPHHLSPKAEARADRIAAQRHHGNDATSLKLQGIFKQNSRYSPFTHDFEIFSAGPSSKGGLFSGKFFAGLLTHYSTVV